MSPNLCHPRRTCMDNAARRVAALPRQVQLAALAASELSAEAGKLQDQLGAFTAHDLHSPTGIQGDHFFDQLPSG